LRQRGKDIFRDKPEIRYPVPLKKIDYPKEHAQQGNLRGK
jgi:hypothetical protein